MLTGKPSDNKVESVETVEEYKLKIEQNGKTVSDVLGSLFSEGKRFVLVGENHTQIDAMHQEVQKSLSKLVEGGVTHLFLENERDMQYVIDSLDINMSDGDCVNYLKQNGIRGTFTSEENLMTMVLAKKLGMQIVFIDDPKGIKQTYVEERIPYEKRSAMDYKQQERLRDQGLQEQDQRDGRMFETFVNSIDENTKGLMVIGSIHVRKSKGEPNMNKTIWVNRVGSRLAERFAGQVSSIRYLYSGSSMDDVYGSKKPTPGDIYPDLKSVMAKPKGIVVMKDEGLFAGDKRICDSDYLMIPTDK